MQATPFAEFRWSFPMLIVCGMLATASAQPPPATDVAEVVDRMVKSEICQLKKLQRYRMTRTYQLRSADGSKDVQMLARVTYDGSTGKTIQVVEERGSEGLYRRALQKIMEAEVRTSHEDGREDTRLGPENYNFKLIGTAVREGQKCYVLQLVPKRKTKYLLDGKAWVSVDDFGLVALEGRPAASISFWVGKPLITQCFQKVGEFWLLASNHSEVDAKVVGRIALNIETRDIETDGTKVELAARHHDGRALAID